MHNDIPKIATSTPDLALERQAQLREMFPEAWGEDGLDFSRLRELLGDLEDERSERYQFSWAGKNEALRLLQTPSHAALHPAPDESLDWNETQNLFIEGDNLEALKLLYKPLFGRVKMIYIDPPYNTGNDFIYPDNFADPLKNYLIQTGQRDPNGDLQTSSPDTAGRVHSRWLSMLYPRLYLARQLLKDDGVIFVSIDDNEVHHLRLLMNQVFGEENFVATFVWKRRASSALAENLVSTDHEYVVAFQRGGFQGFEGVRKDYSSYSNADNDVNGPWTLGDLTVGMGKDLRPNQFYDLIDPNTGNIFPANPNRVWAFIKESMAALLDEGRVVFPSDTTRRPMLKRYQKNLKSEVNPVSTWIKGTNETMVKGECSLESGLNSEGTRSIQELFGEAVFPYSKPSSLINSLVRNCTTADDIILDFFAGSGTTAQAVLELNREDGGNRRFVLVQLPEKTGNKQFPTIADIGKERIRRVVARMKAAQNGALDVSTRETPEDLGFKVWKLGESNFRQMQPVDMTDSAAYLEQLTLMNDALLPGSDPQSVIYEVALREGFSLNCRIEAHPEVAGVWRVSDVERDQWFYLTLESHLELDALQPLNLGADDLLICRGIALDDTTAANLALQCRLKMI